jgi:6-phosphogluconolactonase/glucosamine-6-phosphate isomerase/deaminase
MHRLVVTNNEGAARAIAHGLDSALGNKLKVLWLLSGGSNIKLQLESLGMLQNASHHNLTISLIDERFVPLDSPHSNWHALLDGGLTGEKARLEPPIVDWDLSLHDAAHDWALRLGKRVSEADMVIGQFGVGADGHTAGICHRPKACTNMTSWSWATRAKTTNG